MISEILRRDVEQYAADLREKSPLFAMARSGKVGPEAVAVYLNGLLYTTTDAVRLLDLAGQRAAAEGNETLAAHYRQKVAEETGHYRWAQSDLAGLARGFGVNTELPASAALQELTVCLEREIDEAPVHMLAYSLLLEHLTVLLGSEWTSTLERACGISREHLTVVDNHVALDEAHVEEGLAQIDALACLADLPGLRRTTRISIRQLNAFWDEVAGVARAA